MFQNITNWIADASGFYENEKFNRNRESQPTAYKEIKYVVNSYKSKFGCVESNDLLDDIMTDKRGARSLLTPKHRYSVPIYNPNLVEPANQDEYVKRSEITSIIRTLEFKNFIDNLKCSCDKH